MTASLRARAGAETPAARAPWRSVAIPTEHGGWGLTLEPVVLGLLIAPSGAGVALGCAAMLAFTARTPLKIVLVDRWRGRSLPRTRLAGRVAALEVGLVVAALLVAAMTASGPFWNPLVVAVPFVLVELWFDMRSRSRRLVPELAGTVGIASVGAAIVLADGLGGALAAGAWLLVATRAFMSLPFVRFQLQRAKGQAHHRRAQDLAQAVGLALAVTGVALGWLPLAAMAMIVILAFVQYLLARVPPPRAVVVGMQQLVFGLLIVIVSGVAMR
jgi:hypothetical protein